MDPSLAHEPHDENVSEAGTADNKPAIPDDASAVNKPAIEHARNPQAHDRDPRPEVSAVARNLQLIHSDPTIVQRCLEGQETISAHRAILRHYSQQLAKCFEQDDACGAGPQSIRVSANDAGVFRSLLHWMYYRHIIRFDDCASTLPGLVHLWAIASLYEVTSLCNKPIDLLEPQVHLVAFNKEIANVIWNMTEPSSKLRQFVVKGCARRATLNLCKADGMPAGFCTELMRESHEFRCEIKEKSNCSGMAALELCQFHEHPAMNCRGEPVETAHPC